MVRSSRLHLKFYFSKFPPSLVASQRSTAHCPINFYFSLPVVPTYLIALSSPRAATWSTAVVHERYFFLIQCSVGIWAPSLPRFLFLQMALNKFFYKLLILSVKKNITSSVSHSLFWNRITSPQILLFIALFSRGYGVSREFAVSIGKLKLNTECNHLLSTYSCYKQQWGLHCC